MRDGLLPRNRRSLESRADHEILSEALRLGPRPARFWSAGSAGSAGQLNLEAGGGSSAGCEAGGGVSAPLGLATSHCLGLVRSWCIHSRTYARGSFGLPSGHPPYDSAQRWCFLFLPRKTWVSPLLLLWVVRSGREHHKAQMMRNKSGRGTRICWLADLTGLIRINRGKLWVSSRINLGYYFALLESHLSDC
jgi:hypothetical protein